MFRNISSKPLRISQARRALRRYQDKRRGRRVQKRLAWRLGVSQELLGQFAQQLDQLARRDVFSGQASVGTHHRQQDQATLNGFHAREVLARGGNRGFRVLIGESL